MLYRLAPSLFLLLPEVILTITGVLLMLLEPVLAPGRSRKPLGWLAILGTLLAGGASYDQLRVQDVTAALAGFHNSIRVDVFSTCFHMLIAAVVLVTLLASLDYFNKPHGHAGEYFALICFGATGMMFMTSSTELLMVFIGLEISSISTYILAGFNKGRAAASEASLKYFLLGSFATAFFLYGIALVYGVTGTTSLEFIGSGIAANALSPDATPRLAFLALAMMLIGLGFKVSAAPFHIWTPDVYQGAPAPVVGLMSTAPKAAAFAVILRILNAWPAEGHAHWFPLIFILSVLSMCIGNLGALLQTDVKRMLAYSSIAHAGYLLVAFAGGAGAATSAVMFYTAAYAAMNVGAFAVITQLPDDIRSFDDFTGLAMRRPILAALLSFFLLSLIGIPFTAGFFGKFYAFSAGICSMKLVVIALINSGVACFYYLRLLAALYTKPVVRPADDTLVAAGTVMPRVSLPAAIALAATALATLGLGVLPGRILHLTQRANTASTSMEPASPPLVITPTERN